jgi:hypothetical protein
MIEPIIYEVVGLTLEFMPNGKRTQGSLSVMAGDETFIADLNLTSLQARSKFARAAHELYPETLDEARVKRALNDFAVQLREQQLTAEAKAEESPAEGAISATNLKVPEEGTERYEVAMRILRSDDVLMAAARAMRALGHEGEWRNKMLAFTCAVSAKAQLPVQPSTHAQSSAGKNLLWDTALALLPPDLVYKRTGFSAKALFRTQMSLKHAVLYIQELADSEGADFSIRTLQSDNELRYEATEKQPDGSLANVEYTVEGPTTIIQTTTKNHLHPENETRVVPVYLDESPEQTDRITLAERRRATGKRRGLPPEKRESIRAAWHDAVRLLKPLEVVIPFAERINVPSTPLRLRRDVPRLLNIIRLVAWLHQHTRDRDAHGGIIATEADFERAIEMVGESFSRAWKALSPSEETVYNACTKLPEKLRRGGFKRTHVEKVLEKVGETLSTRTVQACLSNLVEAGYLDSDGKRGAAGATYWITGTKKPGGSITLSDPPAYSRIGGKAGEPSVDKRNSRRSNASARSCASRVGDGADQTAADESVMRKDAQNDSCTSKVLQTGEKEANAQTRNYPDGAGEPTLVDEEPDDGFEFVTKE